LRRKKRIYFMDLSTFLVKAKKATYAEGGDDAGLTLTDGAKELSYVEGKLVYRDRYYGWDPFAGEEVVSEGDRVVWLMNYYGRCEAGVDVSTVYTFLVKALARVAEETPYRGPESFVEGDFRYSCSVEGDCRAFRGSEKISFREKDVYWLLFHGGEITWKDDLRLNNL